MATVRETINHLKDYNPEMHIAVAIWCPEDVEGRADDLDIEVTKSEVDEILDRIDRGKDASLGVNWDTIDCYLDDIRYEKS